MLKHVLDFNDSEESYCLGAFKHYGSNSVTLSRDEFCLIRDTNRHSSISRPVCRLRHCSTHGNYPNSALVHKGMSKYQEATELTKSCMISRYRERMFFYILNIHKQVTTEDSGGNLCSGPKFYRVLSEETCYKAGVPTAGNY